MEASGIPGNERKIMLTSKRTKKRKGKKSITGNCVRKKGTKQSSGSGWILRKNEEHKNAKRKKKAFLKFKMGEIPNRNSQGKPFNGEGASIEREKKNGQKIVQIFGTEK